MPEQWPGRSPCLPRLPPPPCPSNVSRSPPLLRLIVVLFRWQALPPAAHATLVSWLATPQASEYVLFARGVWIEALYAYRHHRLPHIRRLRRRSHRIGPGTRGPGARRALHHVRSSYSDEPQRPAHPFSSGGRRLLSPL